MSSSWITRTKQHQIYTRDSYCCVYCHTGVVDGETLTLDHLFPRSLGGCNDATNLVTCCGSCNSSKKDHSVESFLVRLEHNKGVSARAVRMRIKKALQTPLPGVTAPSRTRVKKSCQCSRCSASV